MSHEQNHGPLMDCDSGQTVDPVRIFTLTILSFPADVFRSLDKDNSGTIELNLTEVRPFVHKPPTVDSIKTNRSESHWTEQKLNHSW